MTPEILTSDLKQLLATAHGKRFILTILQQCGVNSTTYCGDPLSSAFAEGRRSVGVDLIARIKATSFPAWMDIVALEQESSRE